MVQIRDTGLEGLNLGSRANTQARASGVERAMGVITGSRQSSPVPSTKDMTSRESTPMPVDEGAVMSSQADEQNDSMEDTEDTSTQQILLELSVDYDEDADEDYEPTADTTLDEGCNRIDTSSDEDDDSFSDIDPNNIYESPYHDTDPLCMDRLTEEEKADIIDEAREFGIAHIIEKYILTGVHTVKKLLLMTGPGEIDIAPHWTENDLIGILSQRLGEELRRRHRLPQIHTLEHVVQLLKDSKKIMVLTGAGVSVSCGIPDFRSSDGIYSRLAEFKLEDPTQMFELGFFRRNPQVFYSFAREIFPSNFTPSPSHYFIKLLEDKEKLLRNYTQNIDTLEQKAGIHRVLQCHGSFATASCVRCKRRVPGDEIKEAILDQKIAYCKPCGDLSSEKTHEQESSGMDHDDDGEDEEDEDDINVGVAVMKPDIVFFGECLPPEFDEKFEEDRDQGASGLFANWYLASLLLAQLDQLPNNIPQILINRTPITHMEFDVQLLGNCDTIVAELCRMLGWELKHEKLPGGSSNVPDMDKNTNTDGSGKGGRAHWTVIEPNTYTFEGAILGDVEYELSQSTSRKRGRIQNRDTEGYDADTDEESRIARRRGSFMSDRRSSLEFVYSDSDSDSDHSEGTIRGSQPILVSYSLELQSLAEPTIADTRTGSDILQGASLSHGLSPGDLHSQDQPVFADAPAHQGSQDTKESNTQGSLADVSTLDTGEMEMQNFPPRHDLTHGHEYERDVDRRMSTDFEPLQNVQRQGLDRKDSISVDKSIAPLIQAHKTASQSSAHSSTGA
ncbi:NAD-dependent histone deacetylase sir2 [Mortierella sp. NVP85]|nr:NAD-dependent histone deacetylase sir2 [Mortierella sp. NVP85]